MSERRHPPLLWWEFTWEFWASVVVDFLLLAPVYVWFVSTWRFWLIAIPVMALTTRPFYVHAKHRKGVRS